MTEVDAQANEDFWHEEWKKDVGSLDRDSPEYSEVNEAHRERRRQNDRTYATLHQEGVDRQFVMETSTETSEPGVYGRRITVEVFAKSEGEEVKTDSFALDEVVSGPKIGLRTPIFVNMATADDAEVAEGLIREMGIKRASHVANLVKQEEKERLGWADTPEKVEALGGSAQKVTVVKVWFRTEGRLESVVVTNQEGIDKTGYVYGELLSNQPRSIQDAAALGQMYLYSDQDPSVYPLMSQLDEASQDSAS